MEYPGWSRRDFLKRGMLASGLVVAPGLLAACQQTGGGGGGGGGRLEQLRSEGTITVGIAGEKPYGYLAGGELTGGDPAVQKVIWNNLGIDTVDAQQVDFEGLIPGLAAGRFDVVAAGMFITPERCAQAEFSEPMYCAPEAFIVPEGNPDNITDFGSVAKAGVKLAVLGGAVEGEYARQSGVPGRDVVVVGSTRDGLLQVQQGRVGAMGLTSITLKDVLKDNPGAPVELTTPFTPVVNGEKVYGCGGAVFRKGDDDLRNAFNQQLAKLKQSGQLTKIMGPFGFGPETLPPDNLTTQKLCNAA
jgi:polar amino acid transport system substrate-binding protein